jgi:glycosyltransferase involved in cell wall biosynthesis
MHNISVCLTCYNEGPYIGAAVESVLRQTALDQVKEIIIVNDGSTDDSPARLAELRATSELVRSVSIANSGLPAARNHAMGLASGDFIAFLDGDDLWEPTKLEQQMPLFDDPAVGLVYSDFIDFFRNPINDGLTLKVRALNSTGEDLIRQYFVKDGPIIPSSVVIRRSVLETVGGFDVKYRIGEDTDFFMRVALAGFAFRHVAGAFIAKRRHENNITRNLERLVHVFEQHTEQFVAAHPPLGELRRARLSYRYAKVADSLLGLGQTWRGIQYLVRAFRNDPTNARVYAYLASAPIRAWGGDRIMRRVRRTYHTGLSQDSKGLWC